MFPDNNWYGHRKILLKYVGFKDRKVFAWIQHGWNSQILRKLPINKKKNIIPYLFWSKSSQIFHNANKTGHVIGSPFLYLCKMLNDNQVSKTEDKKNKGTLFFAVHFSQDNLIHNSSQVYDHDFFIKKVESLSPGPYTVCFYYYDLTKKNILPYKKKNWKVVCCVKNRIDDYSLYRLYEEINNHQFIVSSEFNTALFYSMYQKKKTKVIISPKYLDTYKNDKYFKIIFDFYKKKYPKLFNNFLSSHEGHKLAKKELGFDYMRSKNELIKILSLNSFIKKFLIIIFAKLYDIKYGKGLRHGKDLKKKKLELYMKVARN